MSSSDHPTSAHARPFHLGLKIQHLRVLATLAEVGLVSRVADALHLTQSAVSKQITEIEGAVPTPVFYRERNRLYLTAAGKRLAFHAQTVLNQLHRAELEVQAVGLGETGHIRVATVTSLAPTLVAKAITLFKEAAPQVSISVVEGHFRSVRPMLERGEIDLAIARMWQKQDLPGIERQMLSAEPIVVTCGRDHPLLKRRRPTWGDACSWPWILPEQQSVARQALDAFWVEHDLTPPSDVIEAQSLPLNLALMQSMPRLCLFPESLAMSHAARGELVVLNLRLENLLVEAGCFWRTGHLLHNEASRLFVDCLVAVGR